MTQTPGFRSVENSETQSHVRIKSYGGYSSNQGSENSQNVQFPLKNSVIPKPIQNAFQLTSVAKYTQVKSDPTFRYKAVQVCDDCYECVKMMFQHMRSKEAGELNNQFTGTILKREDSQEKENQ